MPPKFSPRSGTDHGLHFGGNVYTVSIFSVGWLHLNGMMHLEKTKSKKNGQLGQFFTVDNNDHDKVPNY